VHAALQAVLARGVANIPTSYKLWIAAARLEADDAAKQRVLRRALERIPGSVR
jgi:pre-mRNA-processing factor 6